MPNPSDASARTVTIEVPVYHAPSLDAFTEAARALDEVGERINQQAEPIPAPTPAADPSFNSMAEITNALVEFLAERLWVRVEQRLNNLGARGNHGRNQSLNSVQTDQVYDLIGAALAEQRPPTGGVTSQQVEQIIDARLQRYVHEDTVRRIVEAQMPEVLEEDDVRRIAAEVIDDTTFRVTPETP